MRVVHFEDVPFQERLPRHRDGRFDYRPLVEGTPGSPGNFILEAVRTYGDFYSPRHKHNFDQYRIQLDGEFDFDRNGKMVPGMVAYFPEGTPYGPQSSSEDSLTLVLQFGGASGSGYLSKSEFAAGSMELRQSGEFRKGAFSQVGPDGRKRNKDGYEAVWEHVNKRPLEYPAPRYQDPIFMHPQNFAWVASSTRPGVAWKRLGVFGERCTSTGFLKLDAGARTELPEASLYFVLAGRGGAGAAAWRQHSTLYLKSGETVGIVAEEASEILYLGLPDLSGLAARRPERAFAQAG